MSLCFLASGCSDPVVAPDADSAITDAGIADGALPADAVDPADGQTDSAAPCPAAGNPPGWVNGTEVALAVGTVRGTLVDGVGEHPVTRFRGIPFGESTAGPNRFAAPVPKPCLVTDADEVFSAEDWAAACRQTYATGMNRGSEDCLALNVWAPTRAAAGSNRPVLVWLHGGGVWYGGTDTEGVPGPHFASDGVVTVSINSRVGALGYVADSAFHDESPTGSAAGNYGIMDVIEGLRWVRDHIDAFGGDPSNVTVLGVSGGADRVYYLLASPLARGLFHRAVPHAGTTWVVREPARIERSAATLASHVGCEGVAGEARKSCLRDVPVEAFDDFEFLGEEGFFYANVDGYVLTDQLEHVFASGDYNQVPILTLADAEDRARYLPTTFAAGLRDLDRSGTVGDEGDWSMVLDFLYGNYADDLKAAYSYESVASSHFAEINGSMWAAWQAMETDWNFNCAKRRVADIIATAQTDPSFFAMFSDCPDSGTLPSTCTLGASHGIDLGLIFRASWALNAAEETLAQRMASHWSMFFETGEPNGTGLTVWPQYGAGERTVMRFDSDVPGVDDHSLPGATDAASESWNSSRCDLWDRIWDERGMIAGSMDYDDDGVYDRADNCMLDSNASQSDGDGDSIGDACDGP